MSDRIAEIRARLDEWQSVDLNEHERRGVHAYEGMAADIAWLLDEVEAWRRHCGCCDCQRMRGGEVIGCECPKCKRYRAGERDA